MYFYSQRHLQTLQRRESGNTTYNDHKRKCDFRQEENFSIAIASVLEAAVGIITLRFVHGTISMLVSSCILCLLSITQERNKDCDIG